MWTLGCFIDYLVHEYFVYSYSQVHGESLLPTLACEE